MAVLMLQSCRTEDFIQNENFEQKLYNVSLLSGSQVQKDMPLMKELSLIKSKFRYKSERKNSEKDNQNSILDGAIIGTDKVLLVEKNGVKTYTFAVSRTYLSTISENLVVTENADHSFSGVLIQYDLTKEQQQKFISGEITDIKSKIKVYDIDKININSRIQVDNIGCYEITWETGWCSAGVHYTGGPGGCTVGGAPAPMIISIKDTCNEWSGGETTTPGGNGTGDGSVYSGSIDLGSIFTTIPLVSLGYQYYATEDLDDPNYINYVNTANYFASLGTTMNQFRVTNPDLFYFTYHYFKENGINAVTKAFITERLLGLHTWYEQVSNNPTPSPMNNQYFLNWAFQYLVLNPDITWQEFYNEYLITPCEKLQQQNNTAFQNKINTLKNNLPLKKETGYIENDNGSFTYKDNASATETSNTLSLPDPDYYKDIKGFLHTHPNDYEDSEGRMRKGFKIFSPADVIYFNQLVRNAKDNNLPLDNVYGVMVSGTGIYQIRFSGNANQIKTTYTNTGDEYNRMYINYFNENKNRSDEMNFLKFMDEHMYVKGVTLIKMNSNATFTKKTLSADKTQVVDADCP